MVQKCHNFQFEVKVDGKHCAVEKVSPMFQSDPFPGGLKYICVVSGPKLVKYLSYLPQSKRKVKSQDEASRVLSSLSLIWTDNQGVPLNYFLSSIDEIDYDGKRLSICGVCSPVIKPEA